MDTDNNICTGFVIFVKGKNYFSIFFHDAIEWKIVLKKNFSIFGSVIVKSFRSIENKNLWNCGIINYQLLIIKKIIRFDEGEPYDWDHLTTNTYLFHVTYILINMHCVTVIISQTKVRLIKFYDISSFRIGYKKIPFPE